MVLLKVICQAIFKVSGQSLGRFEGLGDKIEGLGKTLRIEQGPLSKGARLLVGRIHRIAIILEQGKIVPHQDGDPDQGTSRGHGSRQIVRD